MTDLNDNQKRIADTINGIVVVDAGPGTGKTHTIVRRYMNILDNDTDPSDVLLVTFTNNAAAEMEERVKAEIISSGRWDTASVRSSTFDSFCLKVVMESPETVSGFFRTRETLTRGARLVQNETLDQEYFKNVYTKFIRRYGRMYGRVPAILGTSYSDLYRVIQKLMSIGIVPTHEGGWFGRDAGVIYGDSDELTAMLSGMMEDVSKSYSDNRDLHPDRMSGSVTSEMIHDAVNDPRKELISFINGVYYEFIRSSISDNRLTFGLTALFAFIILYSDRQIRRMMSFRYVMVDEFQDTNELQFLISLLILREPNLCAVGDWKQGIYGFRYASIENITEFDERLLLMRTFLDKGEKRTVIGKKKAVHLSLTENYRSTQLIIDTAFRSLRCRAGKDDIIQLAEDRIIGLTAVKKHDLTEVVRLSADNEEKEVLTILQSICEYVSSPGYKIAVHDHEGNLKEQRDPVYGDIAVLCRDVDMCIKIKEAADRYGIPAHLQGDVDIMATREGKLALAWLRYINNQNDPRGPVAILADEGYCLAELKELFPDGYRAGGVPGHLKEVRDVLHMKKRRINDLLTSVFEYHGLNNDITQTIISTISSVHDGSMLTVPGIIRLMETDIDGRSKYTVDALLDGRSVMIQTMHKSKGLEYPIVVIGGLNARRMPSSNYDKGSIMFDPLYGIRLTKEYGVLNGHHKLFACWKWSIIKKVCGPDKAGERRLFFVALSRAKQYITMTCRNKDISTFMTDIGIGEIKKIDPKIDMMRISPAAASGGRPDIREYERRKRRVSLHDIMGEYEESGGGKGEEHGRRVHKVAQRIMSGMTVSTDDDETAYLRSLYKKIKGAKIMTEADCSLPVGDAVIAGRIDMLVEFDDRVEIHDFKTDMNRVNEPRYVIQLSVYAHAASSLGKPVRCVIDYVSRNESVEVGIVGIDEINEEIRRSGL
ncbi:MAG: UvrD-helicase domain-containing protein [Methanomassiliicoccaceae archaeon]|jgi:superfamily I DNA/RNA helicase|nr:UvrD-helicase domain-containing protein [Methanomassiliicoccaceae archaeon]